MAVEVLTDCVIEVDGVDLSDHTTRVVVTYGGRDVDSTAFGARSTQSVAGLPTHSIQCTHQQDFADGSVWATLSRLLAAGRPFRVRVKKASGEIATDNPLFLQAESRISGDFQHLNGSVGELSTFDITYANAGQDGVVPITDPTRDPDAGSGA